MLWRARLRKRPCYVGWHIWVLAFTGKDYVRICEHCGKRP